MKHSLFKAGSMVSLFCLSAPMAFADVSADDVWQNWKAMMTASGGAQLTANEEHSGDTVSITNLRLELGGDGLEGMRMTGTIPELTFRERGDGTVEIVTTQSYQFEIEVEDYDQSKTSFVLAVDQGAITQIASGTRDAISYDATTDLMQIAMQDFRVDGMPQDGTFSVELEDLTVGYSTSEAAVQTITSLFNASALRFLAKGTPETGGSFDISGGMQNLAGASNGVLIDGSGQMSFAELLASGFTSEAGMTYDAGNLSVFAEDPEAGTTRFLSTSQGGSLNFLVDRESMSYGASAKGVSMTGTMSTLPFPELTASYDEALFRLLVPIAKSDTPKDFVFNTQLRGLTVTDMLWSMIDPGGSLPRDPATLIVNTRGQMQPLVDLTDEEAMASGMPPAQIHALDIEELKLSVAGAELNGSGALTFDNSQPPMLGGVAPMPLGKVNLSLSGANGLLGKLQALGLVPPNAVMGFGMMSAMLARPGAGPDTLVSEIEFKPEGIFANGAPLPFQP
jgi:hypothetical protein